MRCSTRALSTAWDTRRTGEYDASRRIEPIERFSLSPRRAVAPRNPAFLDLDFACRSCHPQWVGDDVIRIDDFNIVRLLDVPRRSRDRAWLS